MDYLLWYQANCVLFCTGYSGYIYTWCATNPKCVKWHTLIWNSILDQTAINTYNGHIYVTPLTISFSSSLLCFFFVGLAIPLTIENLYDNIWQPKKNILFSFSKKIYHSNTQIISTKLPDFSSPNGSWNIRYVGHKLMSKRKCYFLFNLFVFGELTNVRFEELFLIWFVARQT